MSDPLVIARDSILAPVGLDDRQIYRLLGQLDGGTIDAADIYFQSSRLQSWVLEDGILKEGNFNIEQGAGVRAVSGEKTGFAYSDELQFPALLEAAQAARAIARSGGEGQGPGGGQLPVIAQLYEPLNPLESLPGRGQGRPAAPGRPGGPAPGPAREAGYRQSGGRP